jgi:hypothetical protein
MVGRDLTEAQWREALPGTPYRPACTQPQALTP